MNFLLETQPKFFEQPFRNIVIGSGYPDDSFQAEDVSAVIHDRSCTFKSVTFTAKALQKGETHIDPVQGVSFDQAAHSDRRTLRFQVDPVKAKTESVITRQDFLGEIACRILVRSQSAVTDETVKVGFIH